MLRIIGCITADHNLTLLAMAVLVCAAASMTTLAMLGRYDEARRNNHRRAWLIGAGVAFGSGVWATHFVAMLAFQPAMPIAYEIAATLLSLAVAICGSVTAFIVHATHRRAAIALGGELLGGTVWIMHGLGVHGMQLAGSLSVDPSFSLSALVIGVSLATLGLWATRQGRRMRLVGTICLTLAVCGLHLTGMAGIEITPGLGEITSGNMLIGSATLGVAVAAVASLIAIVCLLLSIFDRHLSVRTAREDERIHYMAHHDALTNLPNRVMFDVKLAEAISSRQNRDVTVLCIDLDHFKAVNDLLGHRGGDRLLVEVSRRLLAAVRASDTVARLGGDEFAILQWDAGQPSAAEALSQRLVKMLAEPFEINGQPVSIGLSIGIAMHPVDGNTAAVLLKNAETALYHAKRDGRGIYRFFEAAMERRMIERRCLEHDLRQALASGDQLALHYQPIVSCDNGETIGFEALLRWNHPGRGRVSPAEIIPVAEQSGLILPLGRWVLETACAEAARWTEPRRIAVNLSPAQFSQPDIAGMVAEILFRTGLPANRLELEVTESVMIKDTEAALAIFTSLKTLGVRLSLDDFGTGYSSLSYLRRFPFDKLKIDQSFMKELGESREAAALVDAILGLARGLRLEVTAEGVETEAQFQMLRDKGCLQAQGYLLGRPSAEPTPYALASSRSRIVRLQPSAGRLRAPEFAPEIADQTVGSIAG